MAEIVNTWCEWWDCGLACPRTVASDWIRHVYRELNGKADHQANKATKIDARPVVMQATWWKEALQRDEMPLAIRASFDGSRTAKNDGEVRTGFGVVIEMWHAESKEWRWSLRVSTPCESRATVVWCELLGCLEATRILSCVLRRQSVKWHNGFVSHVLSRTHKRQRIG